MTKTFENVIDKFKILSEHTQEKKSIKHGVCVLIKKCPTLMKLLQNMYYENEFYKNVFIAFTDSLFEKMSSERLVVKKDSSKSFLNHYLEQYSSFTINDEDKQLVMAKTLSTEILNDTKSFMFIVTIIDNDAIFSNVVKVALNSFNSSIRDKQTVIPFIEQK